MANIKKTLDYFKHDTVARNDLKLKKLMAVHKAEGYAAYFILLETIYSSENYQLEIPDEETIYVLADECKIDVERFKIILHKAVEIGLFDKQKFEEKGVLTSNGIAKRANVVDEIRSKKSEYIRLHRKKNNDVDGNIEDVDTYIADVDNFENDVDGYTATVKKRKEKKNKKESNKEKSCAVGTTRTRFFQPPTFDEVKAYAEERKRPDLAKRFFDYFSAGDWIDSKGQKVRNWKQKFLTWENKSEGEVKGNGKPVNFAQHDYTKEQLDGLWDNLDDLVAGNG